MGFMWSTPISPLKQSLLDTEPELLLRTGDILLAYASDFEIILNTELWAHTGIIVKGTSLQVFSNGEFVDIHDWIYRHDHVIVRHCDAIRPMEFDSQVMDAANRTADILLRNDIDEHYREGYCVGTVLGMLGLESLDNLARGGLRPSHFSFHSPSHRLRLKDYGEHWIVS